MPSEDGLEQIVERLDGLRAQFVEHPVGYKNSVCSFKGQNYAIPRLAAPCCRASHFRYQKLSTTRPTTNRSKSSKWVYEAVAWATNTDDFSATDIVFVSYGLLSGLKRLYQAIHLLAGICQVYPRESSLLESIPDLCVGITITVRPAGKHIHRKDRA
jgi:hypothetical protein